MSKFKKILLKIHIGILILLIVNFVVNAIFRISLISDLCFILKVLFYISACILFFYYITPFKKISIYFSLYIISPILFFVSWLIDGILGALLGSVFLFFFAPDEIRYENDQIQINKIFKGFLGECCTYEVIEKKYFLFERNIGEFYFEDNLNFRKEDIEIEKDRLKIHLILKNYHHQEDYYITTDTIIYTPLKN